MSDDYKGRVLSARLNPDYEHERTALEEWDRLLGERYAPRQILTNLLNRQRGMTPEMFRREGKIEQIVGDLGERLDAFMGMSEQLKYIQELIEQGFSIDELRSLLDDKFEAIQALVEQSITDLLRQLKRVDPEGLRRFVDHDDEQGDMEFSDEFIGNARQAVRKSFQQRRRERGEGDPE
jgi:hypothetical protein